MKYSNTSRMINLIFHSLIVLAFGALGIYFGLVVAPCYFSNSPITTIEGPYNLYSELGILGLTLCTVSVYGLVNAVKGILNDRDDTPVVKAFNAFIVEGYIVGIFCLLNGVVYFDAIRGGSAKGLGFLIVVMILLFIGLMIATNIPMVKLYDNKDQTPLLVSLGLGAGVLFAWAAVITLGTLIGSWSVGKLFWSGVINSQLSGFLAAYIVCAVLLVLAARFLQKGVKTKLAGNFAGIAGLLTSLMFVTNGVIGLVYGNANDNVTAVHLQGIDHKLPKSGDAYAIICLVVGGLLLAGGVAFMILQGTGKLAKKKAR